MVAVATILPQGAADRQKVSVWRDAARRAAPCLSLVLGMHVVVMVMVVVMMMVMVVVHNLSHGRAGHEEGGKGNGEQRLQHVRLLIRSVL
jgi:hypothetical protein